jgi:aryl-alcohol dehydrogenase-like predicted oxidoreductase
VRYRQVGSSGLTVSAVALGGPTFGGGPPKERPGHIWGALGLDEARPIVHAALDAGITLFDLADAHAEGRSEEIVGTLLEPVREDVVIATKWGSGVRDRTDVAWGSRRYVRTAVEASLRRLRTDYIDLYLMHWRDPKTPIEETLATLTELVREGKIRYAGSSHLAAWEVADTSWIASEQEYTPFVAAQNHYNLLHRQPEDGLVDACGRFGVGLLPYFALGKGLLTGKYRRDAPPPADRRFDNRVIQGQVDDKVLDRIAALDAFAKDRGHTLAELAIAALLAQSTVASVATGATTPEQISDNAAAAEWELTEDDLAPLRELLEGES